MDISRCWVSSFVLCQAFTAVPVALLLWAFLSEVSFQQVKIRQSTPQNSVTLSINTSVPVPLTTMHAQAITLPELCLKGLWHVLDHEVFHAITLVDWSCLHLPKDVFPELEVLSLWYTWILLFLLESFVHLVVVKGFLLTMEMIIYHCCLLWMSGYFCIAEFTSTLTFSVMLVSRNTNYVHWACLLI